MRRRAQSISGANQPHSPTVPSIHAHVTSYRSVQLEVQLYSPSLKLEDGQVPLAVFGPNDRVTGKVYLDASCHSTGQLSINLEGAFHYENTRKDEQDTYSTRPDPEPRKYVFLSMTSHIAVSANEKFFQNTFMRRRPSISCLSQSISPSDRVYSFSFALPKGCRAGEDLPSSFSSLKEVRPVSRPFAVLYKVTAFWEPSASLDNSSSLEVPIIVQSEDDFHSVGPPSMDPEAWTEWPLKTERPIPFRCAVTLPSSISFSRSSAIPYFVVFTTIPRSATLAKEIAADASVSVSFFRRITVLERSSLPTPPVTPLTEITEPGPSKGKLIRKIPRNMQRPSRSDLTKTRDKPLPDLPMQLYMDTQTLQNDVSIGFQKRPRHQCAPGTHPPLNVQASLPDGLHKGKIKLNQGMLPCIDWNGISVKYYLDVSVLVGQDEFRGRIPLQLR